MSYRRFRAGGGANFTWTAWEPRAAPVARAVLLHGMGSAASEFAPLGEALAARGYLAQAPDLRANGHGLYSQAEDKLDQRRGGLVSNIEERLAQNEELKTSFTLRWRLGHF